MAGIELPMTCPSVRLRRRSPGRDSGSILKVERHSVLDLDRQVQVNGVTWLDQELARGSRSQSAARVGATRFERQLAAALKERAARLRRSGFGGSRSTASGGLVQGFWISCTSAN